MAESENITYLNCSNILVAFSKENGSAKILCEKPNCEHISINSDACGTDLRTLGVIKLEKKSSNFNETIHIIGSDRDRIFYRKEVTEEKRKREMICYINKSDISKNGTMIKIAYESMIN